MIEKRLKDEYQNVHAILIARNDKLVVEKYFDGRPIYGDYEVWQRSTLHNLHSVTKSFTSALLGIALERSGGSLDARLVDFFPEFDDIPMTGGRENITLAHALSMSSGLTWDEGSYSYDDSRNSHAAMYESQSWIHYVLEQPMAAEPGEVFVYNSGLSITLGGVISKITGQSVGDFCQSELFAPLGISKRSWHVDLDGTYQTGGGLSLTPRGMIKFGLLFLNDGRWKEQQIISADWVRESTGQKGPRQNYGYHWWLTSYDVAGRTIEAFYAGGRGGQYIIVFRDLDMVVVFTAGNDNELAFLQPRDMLVDHILPAVM
jgi:CubicO group peptidase (beta-lactamase class C family)